MTTTDDSDHNGRATIRDVVALVGEVREDLGGRIDRLADRVDAIVQNHEGRISVVETRQSAQAEQISLINQRLDTHGRKIGELADRAQRDEAATSAITDARARRSNTNRWLIGLLVLLLASGLGTILGIFVH